MSIRLRLTLIYSAILALTLIVLCTAIYIVVSQVTINVVTTSLSNEARNLSLTLQAFRDPDKPGAIRVSAPQGSHDSLTSVQARSLDGRVVYQSSDLTDDHITLPLDGSITQPMARGREVRGTIYIGARHYAISTVALVGRSQQGNGHGPGPGQGQPGAGSPPNTPGETLGVIQVARSLDDVDRTLTTLRQALLIGGVVATLLAFGAGWALAGATLRPIRRITQSAQEIGEVQDFGRRVAYSGPRDELGVLASTLNTMLARLQDAFQVQRRFAADASHELRTPLTSIRGNLGLLQREPPIAEGDRVAVLSDLVSESERLSRLVNDLLTLARGDAGRHLRAVPVPLGPLLTDLIRQHGVSYPGRSVQLPDRLDDAVLGDPDALTQVLLILLDNALKFTSDHGTVGVRVSRHGSTVAIAVHDTGPGIAPEALPHVFERFYRGDTARAGAGTGLGLAIARALVEGQHGTIAVQSEVGSGSVFTVTMPAAP